MCKNYQLKGACLRVKLPGELDHETSEKVKEETEDIMEKNHVNRMILDFKDTIFMDSSGIGMIMSRYRALGMRRGCIVAESVNERIHKILCLSGMHKILLIRDTDE